MCVIAEVLGEAHRLGALARAGRTDQQQTHELGHPSHAVRRSSPRAGAYGQLASCHLGCPA